MSMSILGQSILWVLAAIAFFWRRQKFVKEDVELAKAFEKAEGLKHEQTDIDSRTTDVVSAFEKLRAEWYAGLPPNSPGSGSSNTVSKSPDSNQGPTDKPGGRDAKDAG